MCTPLVWESMGKGDEEEIQVLPAVWGPQGQPSHLTVVSLLLCSR
jgi:hypothetical protein